MENQPQASTLHLPRFDLSEDSCGLALVDALHDNSAALVRFPGLDDEGPLNAAYLAKMQEYYSQPWDVLKKDFYPEQFCQLGISPAGHERTVAKPSDWQHLPKTEWPQWPKGGFAQYMAHGKNGGDQKLRVFFGGLGPAPENTLFSMLNHQHGYPETYVPLLDVLKPQGALLLRGIKLACERIAEGFGWPADTIWGQRMAVGPHLLAPTGTKITYAMQRSLLNGGHPIIAAGFHRDCNLLTIHNRANAGGLHAWVGGKRMRVVVPDGYLLIQVASQLESLTGGFLKAGFHEVVIDKDVVMQLQALNGFKDTLIRVSSTVFGHGNSDYAADPVRQFAIPTTIARYGRRSFGDMMMAEIQQTMPAR